MIVTLAIPDDIYKTYAERSPEDPNGELVKQLTRFIDFPVSERPMIVPPEVRKELEALYENTLEDPRRLVDWVKRMISIRVDELVYTLSAAQRRSLEGEARFYPSKTAEGILKDKLKYGLSVAFGGQV